MTLAKSYTSANVFPIKVLKNSALMESINKYGKIIPVHLQLNPSNKCNFHCDFCSCENRDRTSVLEYDKLRTFLSMFKVLGGQSSTVTGGGDPLTYPWIDDMLHYHKMLGLDVGMVCNGSLLNRLSSGDLDCLTWMRISCSDNLPKQTNVSSWFDIVQSAVNRGSRVGWAFSYVISEHPDLDLISRIIGFANTNRFTHVRIVSDLLGLDSVASMGNIKQGLKVKCVDDSRVIYQGRKQFTSGQKKCYISLAKPVLSAEGKLLACCGWQYRNKEPSRDYDSSDAMGDMFDLPKLIQDQSFYNGENCYRCYYREYNELFGSLLDPVEHGRFI